MRLCMCVYARACVIEREGGSDQESLALTYRSPAARRFVPGKADSRYTWPDVAQCPGEWLGWSSDVSVSECDCE